jgi:DNA (cytosine-5)-methyltransferase 1
VKPRAVELFGGEGISALGYALAGFRVDLVENDPVRIANAVQHPDIKIIEGDATTHPLDNYDVVTGGPPCTGHSETAGLANAVRGREAGTEWMLPHTLRRVREWAAATGGLWVIENVEGAREHFQNPIKLCGTQFGIEDDGWSLQRHRWFESNALIAAPGPCRHAGRRFIHVHGDLSANDRSCGGRRRPGGDMRAGIPRAKRLMGAPWASPRGLSLGVPVAYTRHLGNQVMRHLDRRLVTTGSKPSGGDVR